MPFALLFDTETTGFFRYDRQAHIEGQPRLCSIAAELLDMETRKVVTTMHRLCDGATITRGEWMQAEEKPHGAFEYNKLSASLMMAEGVPIMTILREFQELEDQVGVEGYVAYVADYDLKVMRGERRRHNLNDRYNHLPHFDPKEQMKHLVGLKKGPKQSVMYEGLIGKPMEQNASKARGDLTALREIFLVALDKCQPIDWRFHKSKGMKADV